MSGKSDNLTKQKQRQKLKDKKQFEEDFWEGFLAFDIPIQVERLWEQSNGV